MFYELTHFKEYVPEIKCLINLEHVVSISDIKDFPKEFGPYANVRMTNDNFTVTPEERN
jgi:hypothetical protein